MKNYAAEWKKDTKLRQISYNDFVSLDIVTAVLSQKVDGMLGALVYKENEYSFLQTTSGGSITDIPVITEYEIMFKKLGIKSAILLGELVARKGGRILPFNLTQSIVKKHYLPENKDLIFHYPVDVNSINNKLYAYNQALAFLFKHIGKVGLPHIKMPKTIMGGLTEFRDLYNEIKDDPGFDGVVARGVGGKNYKIKFVDTADVVIIGAGNENMKSWPRGHVSYLLTSFIDKSGIYRSSSKIGTGFDHSIRKSLFNYIKKNTLYKNEKGDFFVKPKLIVELKYFRYRITNTPSYRFIKGRYDQVGNDLSITFSHPSFERIRTDKRANKDDVRLEQIPEFKY